MSWFAWRCLQPDVKRCRCKAFPASPPGFYGAFLATGELIIDSYVLISSGSACRVPARVTEHRNNGRSGGLSWKFRLRRKRTFGFCSPQSFGPFFQFFLGFALNTFRGDGSRHEPFLRDGSSTGFADPIGPIINSIQCLFDLGDQLSFTILDSQEKVPIRFKGGSVRGIWEIPIALVSHSVYCFFSFLD